MSTTPSDPPEPEWSTPADIARAWERELPGVHTGSIEVLTTLQRVARVFARERERLLAQLGMDAATLDLLSTLRRSGPPYALTTRVLAARCMVSAGAISQRITRAESDGLVRRESPSADRSVLVQLTPTAHERLEPVVRALLEAEERSIGDLGAAERAQLTGLLSRLHAT